MPTDPTGGLRSALATTTVIVERVRPDQAPDPSPCAEWTVQGVVEHVTGSVATFATALGASPGAPEDTFAAAARRLAGVLDDLGTPDRVVTVPLGTVPVRMALGLATVEVLVHGWDIATATHQQVSWDQGVAQEALAFSERALAAIPSDRSPFGPPRPAAPTAPAIDRLVALLGRGVA